jgi:hypothetical protein
MKRSIGVRCLLLASIFCATQTLAASTACRNFSTLSFDRTVLGAGQTAYASGPFSPGDNISIVVSADGPAGQGSPPSEIGIVDQNNKLLLGPSVCPGVCEFEYDPTTAIGAIGVRNLGDDVDIIGDSTCTTIAAASFRAAPTTNLIGIFIFGLSIILLGCLYIRRRDGAV